MPFRIYKYIINQPVTTIPKKSQILKVDVQNDRVCLWAIVDTEDEGYTNIAAYTTGENIEGHEDKTHLGTFLLLNGTFVLHVFKNNY